MIRIPVFWIFGFWGVVGPLFAAVKAHRLVKALEAAHDADSMQRAFEKSEGDEVIIDLVRVENRIPKWLARRIYYRVKPRLLELAAENESADRSPDITGFD